MRTFKAAGFTAYDDKMIREITAVMAVSPRSNEFQFDIFPDGTVGNIFSLSTSFGIEQPQAVLKSFKDGYGAKYIDLLKQWDIADDRWKKGIGATFAGALPSGEKKITFSIFPQWIKVRWTDTKLQPAKMYMLIKAGELP